MTAPVSIKLLGKRRILVPSIIAVFIVLLILSIETGFDAGNLLSVTMISATPLILGSIGEIYAELSGVMNLGVDGMMSTGAVLGVVGAVLMANPWGGVALSMLGGGLLALAYGIVVIKYRGMQVPAGLGVFMFGLGLSGIIGGAYVGLPLPFNFPKIPIPVLADIPVIGKFLFNHDILVYITYALVFVFWFILYKTKIGLNIRSTGEDPGAADSAGINVFRVRYLCVILGGVLAGLAGGYLSLAWTPGWTEGMVAGRGWIVISLTIFSLWGPARALLGAWIFGGVYAGQYLLQGLGIPVRILGMLPYVVTIVALSAVYLLRKRLGAPTALGEPYKRE